MLRTETYYIAEQTDIFQHFAEEGISLPAEKARELRFISRKTHNNLIGYYQFLQDGVYYKFFVIPKIHKTLPDAQKEEAFMAFLGKYYELKNKYDAVKTRAIDGNIIDFSFEDYQANNAKTTEIFIQHKYLYAITLLHKFFRKHHKNRERQRSYVSQSVKHRIDVTGNIRSLDKSKVHQIRRETEPYSLLASIAEYALKRFKQEKIPQFSTAIDALRQEVNSTLNVIRKKYTPDRSFKFRERDILTNKIVKLFKKSTELKRLYETILILLGLEYFQNEEEARTLRKIDNMLALFFNPADLYEWVVYDYLREKYGEEATILSDKLGETKRAYSLYSNSKEYRHTSQPDFVIEEVDYVTVIDAKWKILKQPMDIKFEDIAKLKRDVEVRKSDGNVVDAAMLIYPKVNFSTIEENLFRLDYDYNFSFYVEQLEV